ncbi:hypothetical protein [Helcococcus kunzii]|uniref:Uncharacterized protein n=1 Tax=Helcococcus kunzii ATCC 51366 TaxID=883114 RepID=H3NPG3_9FIRM|nr:hypothetical protein [Helcococcus kunzii]EHR33476.1 hypothetical protein HMPREF9709_01224 [Helcococcus kunzii ATCC 51366]
MENIEIFINNDEFQVKVDGKKLNNLRMCNIENQESITSVQMEFQFYHNGLINYSAPAGAGADNN